jgi:hypothetical protein
MSGEIWIPESNIRAKCRPGKKKLPIEQRVITSLGIYSFFRKRGWVIKRQKTSWAKGENGLNEKQFKRWC